jgi:hypothetical protein
MAPPIIATAQTTANDYTCLVNRDNVGGSACEYREQALEALNPILFASEIQAARNATKQILRIAKRHYDAEKGDSSRIQDQIDPQTKADALKEMETQLVDINFNLLDAPLLESKHIPDYAKKHLREDDSAKLHSGYVIVIREFLSVCSFFNFAEWFFDATSLLAHTVKLRCPSGGNQCEAADILLSKLHCHSHTEDLSQAEDSLLQKLMEVADDHHRVHESLRDRSHARHELRTWEQLEKEWMETMGKSET